MENQLSLLELKKCTLRSSCPKCGSMHGLIYPSQNNTHSGFIRCYECDRFLKWISKREFDRARKMGIVN